MNIKTRSFALRCAALCCAFAVALPLRTAAAVDDEQFKELKDLVNKLGQKIDKQDQRIDQLEKTHAQDGQVHAQDQKIHEQDQQKIQELQQKVGETQRTVAEVQQKAAMAAPVEPLPRMPLEEATVNHNFSILGDAEVQYAKTSGQHGTFLFADFAPVFLYRGGDKVLFEAGFDFGLQNNERPNGGATTTINLSFAHLDYLINDYVTLVAGNMLLPLGTYSERVAGWLNKIPDDVGLRSDNAVANLHGKPSGGARVGWFMPFKPHYDLELGLSGQSGEWDDAGRHTWSGGALDASLHLGANFDIKGEYIRSWYGTEDHGNVRPEGWWLQSGYKLAGLNLPLPLISNMELVGRYDTIHDGLGTRTHRYTLGYIYYFSNTLLFEGDYEFLHSNDPSQKDQLIFQLSYGF